MDGEGEYTGQFFCGARSGYGVMKWGTGDEYRGEWRGGRPEGRRGTMIRATTGEIYEGGWKGGRYDGYGVLCERDGCRYEGL